MSASTASPAIIFPERLLIRLRVEEFLSAYERCIDDDDLEKWPEFFTQDATYSIRPRENWDADLPIALMLCKGRDMMHDRVRAQREANIYGPHVYRHFHSGLEVAVTDSGFMATANYAVVQTLSDGESKVYQAGRTYNDLVEADGGLLLSQRRVIYDTHRVQTLLVTPI